MSSGVSLPDKVPTPAVHAGHSTSFPLPTLPASASPASTSALPPLPPGLSNKGLSPEMEEILREQARVEQLLGQVEVEIAKREDDYFERTAHGNIVRGWEGVLDNKPPPKRRYEGRERVFTWSSYTYWSRHGAGAQLQKQASDASLDGSKGFADGEEGVKRNRVSVVMPSPRDPKVMAARRRKKRQQQRRNHAGMGESSEDDEEMFM